VDEPERQCDPPATGRVGHEKILDPDIRDRQRDRRLDKPGIRPPHAEGREREAQRVTDREGGDHRDP
jgi:hypothetical protein